jgi:hypothetical protein|tara:strand:- start:3011 stop:3322 length:312 start_codon:yes stop_codon:yes gene_type:complete
MFRDPKEMADFMKSFTPQFKTNKNGYEIRTKILEMAQNEMWNDYHAKFGAWSTSIAKDGEEIAIKVEMPTVPGVSEVLETAEKFYSFVEGNNSKNNSKKDNAA